MKFSIIIPVKEINGYIRENVEHIKRLKSSSWDLIILPNGESFNEWQDKRIRIIPTGKVSPAVKRDIGTRHSTADAFVFLDDDSFPSSELLTVAEKYMMDQKVVAIGGPQITPVGSTFFQRVSGAFFQSRFTGGFPHRYSSHGCPREVTDWPSVNLIVAAKAYVACGGFDSDYWPGEDTKFCHDMLMKTGQKILYVPELIVYHHRRDSPSAHLKQIAGYGLHRGHFARILPRTSNKLFFYFPSFFFLYILITLLTLVIFPSYAATLVYGWSIYLCVLFLAYIDIVRFETPSVAIGAILYAVPSHATYGLYFLKGLMSRKLESKLR